MVSWREDLETVRVVQSVHIPSVWSNNEAGWRIARAPAGHRNLATGKPGGVKMLLLRLTCCTNSFQRALKKKCWIAPRRPEMHIPKHENTEHTLADWRAGWLVASTFS